MTEAQPLSGFNAVCDDIRDQWILYFDSMQFPEGVPLSARIDMFLPLVSERLRNKYPTINQAPAETYWMIVFTAIFEAQTHSKEAVNAAIQELERKYRKTPTLLDRARKWLRDRL